MGLFLCSKELKDPDQLYSTLKNILQQVKVKHFCTTSRFKININVN